MRFSPLWFWGLRHELERELVGAVVGGCRVEPEQVQMGFAAAGRSVVLRLWLAHGWGRAEIGDEQCTNRLPQGWEVLQGATCERVEQPYSDRRLILLFRNGGRVIELDYFAFTRPSVVLRSGGELVVAIGGGAARKPNPPAMPFILSEEAVAISGQSADMTLKDWFSNSVRGADSLWFDAALVATTVKGTDVASPSAVTAVLSFFRERATEYEGGPGYGFVAWRGPKPAGHSLVDLHAWLPEVSFARHESLSLASAALARAVDFRTKDADSRDGLLRRAEVLHRKLQRRLERLRADFAQQSQHDTWRQNADWLLAQLSQLQKGASSIEVPHETGTRTVPMDPAIRPEKQAEQWYSRARRLRRGMKKTQEQIERTRREVDLLERSMNNVRADATHDAPDAWAKLSEVVRQSRAIGTTQGRAGESEARPRVSCRRFRSPGGLAIWVGRTDAENDELTFHQAHKKDLWFHAQQCPGSHVILRSHALKRPPSKTDVLAAAAAAAYYSKARNSSKVPVIYTEARYVRKPRRAPAGQVMVEREKSIMVTPKTLPEWDDDESE